MSAPLTLEAAVVHRGGRPVLHAVGCEVQAGEVVGVVGPNGAGKTTLLRAALGLQPLSGGSSHIGGEDVRRLSGPELARRAGYLPQERRLAWNLPAWRAASLGALFEPPARAREIALEALAEVGLAGLAERGVFDMSGGERARVLLARLLATRARLLLADEPTAGLDPEAQLLAMELLRRQAAGGAAVLVTLHDLGLAARSCDRLIVLDHGRLAAEGPPAAALSPEVLAKVFALRGRLMDTPTGPVLAATRLGDAA
jgi:iron complex transport system ATP-binding protein